MQPLISVIFWPFCLKIPLKRPKIAYIGFFSPKMTICTKKAKIVAFSSKNRRFYQKNGVFIGF
jgi:hypothetical protein